MPLGPVQQADRVSGLSQEAIMNDESQRPQIPSDKRNDMACEFSPVEVHFRNILPRTHLYVVGEEDSTRN